MVDASCSASELSQLIDELMVASTSAAIEDAQYIEKTSELFESLKKVKVDTKLLVDTQGGKKLRKLTKHIDLNIKANAAELLNIWKGVVAAEAAAVEQSKAQLGGLQPEDPTAASGISQLTASQDSDAAPPPAKRQKSSPGMATHSIPTPTPSPKPAPKPAPKPLKVPQTADASRNKIRQQLAEAINLAWSEVPEGDAGARAAEVEAAVLAAYGAVNPKYKAKIRSLWVNLKDPKNPDFRQAVLQCDISGEEMVTLKPEEMASRSRQEENQKIRDAAMFEAERGRKNLATTDQFQCGRCKKRQTSYYQMQTRSADEPMTTFVICQVCDNRWKFC